MIFSSTVHPPFKPGTALVDYLTTRFTYHDRETWRGLIASGRIACNDRTVTDLSASVGPGDLVSYDPGEFEEPEADLSYRIIYEDEWLLGIDKPGNLLVHRAGKSVTKNLVYQLRNVHVPPWPQAHSIHRLDRDTSGVLIVAKNSEVMAALANEQAFKKYTKIYYAVVRGSPQVGEIDLPLGKPAGSAIPYKFCVMPGGKPAVTKILESQRLGTGHSLLTLQPVTGRTHQIRVHLEAVGAPVVGDKLYGRSEEEYLKWRDDPLSKDNPPGFPRHALHCASMTFAHPFTKEQCRIEAETPDDMKGLVASLSK
jgi:RluA family pseudouridine synthase